jgi:hypothetical protein
MTKQDLVKIIKDNFTNQYGVIELRGLKFDCNVDISNMEVNGSLRQGSHKVKGDLHQGFHQVDGYLFQANQEVKGEIFN